MLKYSHEEVMFIGDEKIKNLVITNELGYTIIYKIKTNNLKVLEAAPNFGFIKNGTPFSITIKTSDFSPFEAKLQV